MAYEDILKDIYKEAKRKGACDKFPCFDGSESVEQLAKLMFTPQGREFCLENRFPSLETLRTFKEHHPEQYDVYIDSGDIELHNTNALLVGDTNATIYLDELKGFDVLLMHGGNADVKASGYAVVTVKRDNRSTYTIDEKDEAIVVC